MALDLLLAADQTLGKALARLLVLALARLLVLALALVKVQVLALLKVSLAPVLEQSLALRLALWLAQVWVQTLAKMSALAWALPLWVRALVLE